MAFGGFFFHPDRVAFPTFPLRAMALKRPYLAFILSSVTGSAGTYQAQAKSHIAVDPWINIQVPPLPRLTDQICAPAVVFNLLASPFLCFFPLAIPFSPFH